MDVTPVGTFRINYLIFETDLSEAISATDIELDFDRSDHGDENQANDRVRIR